MYYIMIILCGWYTAQCGSVTFTAFTSFLANFENFSRCFQFFLGKKHFFSKRGQKIVNLKKIENIFITWWKSLSFFWSLPLWETVERNLIIILVTDYIIVRVIKIGLFKLSRWKDHIIQYQSSESICSILNFYLWILEEWFSPTAMSSVTLISFSKH